MSDFSENFHNFHKFSVQKNSVPDRVPEQSFFIL